MLFVVFVTLKFNSYQVGFAFFGWSMVWLILIYREERLTMKMPDLTKRVLFDFRSQSNRSNSYGIAICNLVTYPVLWLLPIMEMSPFENYWISIPPILFFALVLYWDFSRLGRMIAHRGQDEEATEIVAS